MSTPHPHDALALAHEHGRALRADAAAERLHIHVGLRDAVAASLRRAADRLDPSPVARVRMSRP